MSTSGAIAGCFSFIAPESEESHFSIRSGFLQQTRLPSFRTGSGLAPSIFPSKQPVCGNTEWGHISEQRASGVHTEPQPAHSGDYTQSSLTDSVRTELSTVPHQLPAKLEVHGSNDCGFFSSSRTTLMREHLTSGACSTDTDTLSIRTDKGGKNEQKRGIDQSKIMRLLNSTGA